jgi:hypothetical protein
MVNTWFRIDGHGGTPMETAIVLFTRDLRLHDNPALHQACSLARQVVPLFVQDPAITAPPNRARFLAFSSTGSSAYVDDGALVSIS